MRLDCLPNISEKCLFFSRYAPPAQGLQERQWTPEMLLVAFPFCRMSIRTCWPCRLVMLLKNIKKSFYSSLPPISSDNWVTVAWKRLVRGPEAHLCCSLSASETGRPLVLWLRWNKCSRATLGHQTTGLHFLGKSQSLPPQTHRWTGHSWYQSCFLLGLK